MAGKNKEVLINIRLKPETREEFRISAELRGGTMSGLLHQFIVRTIREEKERDPKAFSKLEGTLRTGGSRLASEGFDPQLFPKHDEIYKRHLSEKEKGRESSGLPSPTVINRGPTDGSQKERRGRRKSDG